MCLSDCAYSFLIGYGWLPKFAECSILNEMPQLKHTNCYFHEILHTHSLDSNSAPLPSISHRPPF